MAQRVIVYIDGFNLYFGLKEMGWRRYYWLDFVALSNSLLKPDQKLVQVKYFTARLSAGDKKTPQHIKQIMEAKRRRQALYLEALTTLNKFKIYEGHYLAKAASFAESGGLLEG